MVAVSVRSVPSMRKYKPVGEYSTLNRDSYGCPSGWRRRSAVHSTRRQASCSPVPETSKSPVGNSQIESMLVQLRDRQIAREQMETYERQEAAAVKERTLREAAAVAAQQRSLTESRIAIEIAENNGLAQVKTQTRQGEADAAKIRNVAVADADRIKAIGAANANRIELEGAATALAAQKQVEAYGGPEIRLAQEISAQITRAIADGKLPVVPQVVVGGNGSNTNAIEAITAMIMAAGQEFRNRGAAPARSS